MGVLYPLVILNAVSRMAKSDNSSFNTYCIQMLPKQNFQILKRLVDRVNDLQQDPAVFLCNVVINWHSISKYKTFPSDTVLCLPETTRLWYTSHSWAINWKRDLLSPKRRLLVPSNLKLIAEALKERWRLFAWLLTVVKQPVQKSQVEVSWQGQHIIVSPPMLTLYDGGLEIMYIALRSGTYAGLCSVRRALLRGSCTLRAKTCLASSCLVVKRLPILLSILEWK